MKKNKYNPPDSILRKHQLRMLDILIFVDRLCEKYNIKYWLASGTLLGAVRHSGFIPWDDDLDIEMPLEDFEKFLTVFQQQDENPYLLQTHLTDNSYVAPYAKIRDRKSKIWETQSRDQNYVMRGIYIDVFPVEFSNSFLTKIFNRFYGFFVYRSSQKNKYDKYGFRRNYVNLMYFVFMQLIRPIFRLFNNRKRGIIHLSFGSGFNSKRYVDDIHPLSKVSFEGFLFNCPNNFDNYLKTLYGDYMKIPENKPIHTNKIDFFD